MTKFIYCVRFFVYFSLVFLFSAVFHSHSYAFENPHLYYDWNNYYDQKVLGIQAFAQESTESAQTAPDATAQQSDYHDYSGYNGYLFGLAANSTPDSPFYFLKRLQENVVLTFTFDSKAKEQIRLAVAGERLGEIEEMVTEGKAAEVTSLAQAYNDTVEAISDNLTDLKQQNQDVTSLMITTDLEAAKHTLVLEEVSLKVPPQAEQGIETALAASEKAVDTVADLAGRPAVPPDVIARLQALQSQGLLTADEVEKLTALKSRVAAREEFRKLADDNVLPQADFKKLDEAARSYFPAAYANIIEFKKFQELRNLETQKPDEATLVRVQAFADTYKPGESVPQDLRRWWVPMIRLEELQNTFRPDLISENFFRYRPDDQQKYRELVERVKPRAEDVAYVNGLFDTNPQLVNDPAYARIKALAEKFGTVEGSAVSNPPQAQSCSRDAHWVLVPFMPNGGYCVPNIVYAPIQGTTPGTPCPPGYHRNDPQGACYPDNPYGPGAGPTTIASLPASGTCSSGYHWVPEPSLGTRGYCAPDYPSAGGGSYPGPIAAPSYCPNGQIFRDGKCETYNPPPAEGCPQNYVWTGQKCVGWKSCGAGSYMDSNGECKQSTSGGGSTGGGIATCPAPASCTSVPNSWWDYGSCTCRSTLYYPTPGGTGGTGTYQTPAGTTMSRDQQEASCKAGGGTCTWQGDICNCQGYTYQTPSYSTPTTGGTAGTTCGPGYYWNGSYCALTTGGGTYSYPTPGSSYSYPTPGSSYSYPTPSYYTPGSYQYPTPSSYSYPTPGSSYTYPTPSYYGTPAGTYTYPTPSGSYSYPTPGTYYTPSGYSYPTPSSYGTPAYGTPSYGTPSYGTPAYSTPSYGTPSYGTPEYSTPSYGTPSYGTPDYPAPYGTP